MSSIGGWEILILIVIGLIILGPKRLPQVANQLGSWVGQARRMTRQLKRQLEDELDLDEQFQAKANPVAPPIEPESAPHPADPAYDYDVEENAHVPNDDDTYSPLHDEHAEDDGAAQTDKNA